ncbi:MAG: hypothetical protein H6703_05760 [Myxococcales bacterium]|nr:hypothetical protein [Myxococcales bacterium]
MRTRLLALSLCAALAGCADEDPPATAGPPVITEVSSSALVVGETVEFFGTGLLPEDGAAEHRLRFTGTFEADDGERVPVDFAIAVAANAEQGNAAAPGRDVLTWRRFGPYHNPFTGDARIGTFRGDVRAIRTDEDGLTTEGRPAPVVLTVEPSVMIERFEPLDADCGAPALRALAGLPYRLHVRVAGLRATRFVYELDGVNANPGVTRIEHDFGRGNPVAVDVLGEDEAILFDPVPSDTQFYVSGVRVIAIDDEGKSVETAMPVGVHRPIEVRYGGEYALAELYEPEPVSGCIPGSIGSSVSYQETHTETRQQSVSVTVASSWRRQEGRTVSETLLEGVSVGESQSRTLGESTYEGDQSTESYGVTYGQSSQNTVNVSTRDGESWSFNVNEGESNEEYASRMDMLFGEGSWSGTVGASGEGSIPGFAKVSGKVETTVGVKGGASTQDTTGSRRRVSQDTGYGMSGARDETRSFGSTVGENRSESLSGSYALSTSRQRSMEDRESRSQSHVWNMSEGVAESESVSVGLTEAESQTWVTSESLAVSQGYTGLIPRTRVGIFYRQTTRWVRRAEVRTYDLCGLASHAGELQFNEWTWAAELAIGEDCSTEPPPSELPAAQCFISPCGG